MILDGSFFIAVKPGTHCQICFGSPVGTSPRLERKFNFHRLDESSWALYLPHFAPGQGDAGSGPWPTLDDLATPCLSLSLSWCLLTTAIESNYQAVSRRPFETPDNKEPHNCREGTSLSRMNPDLRPSWFQSFSAPFSDQSVSGRLDFCRPIRLG
ncbi:hypothetical protein SNK03_007914 [Fusarium graminearum]|uniref:Chromosome 4, complete genome n=1 Tax=Gibberella zeae (strain ATCC MYA-4620 / CBS 123657 / FGSC 9075 / NRRL 31084 / PH-1) TaxID=229533 RepID=I1S7X8_GIBZE|nr:hypothetical protein FGSG_12953 [Fusarium graminearum PH-1]ESU12753.1 hypothetical protein FGSG_12953 [Fusarium graminearum PH-1]CEF84836.1 unnamed protein product [Fusarium graminearum]CZS72316.1 unnamed protein product [Fusarium graminearum]|eukprot:XP_011326260.1 hypothetical protein FGSG_12953 [Fusarium graminearum PH-1]